MCWMVPIHVVLQKDTPTTRSGLTLPAAGVVTLEGTFPDYWVTNGVCGCGSVLEPDGRALEEDTMRLIRQLLSLPPVKRIEVLWWWGDLRNRPGAAGEERITLTDFEARNAKQTLAAGVRYRINDPAKFRNPSWVASSR